ncbi:MAG: hypothetical protein ACYCO3_10975 [Mycobacteriales bacterium]
MVVAVLIAPIVLLLAIAALLALVAAAGCVLVAARLSGEVGHGTVAEAAVGYQSDRSTKK